MIKTSDNDMWGVVQERRRVRFWSVAAHRIGSRPETVLVAKCTDGRWATNALRHDRPREVVPLTSAMAFRGRLDQLYEVDTSLRVIVFAVSLPTDDPDISLKADVQVCWQITDPVRAVTDPLRNPDYVVRPAVERELFALFERSDMQEPAEFERIVADKLRGMQTIATTGLRWGRVLVRVRPTDANVQAVRMSRVLDREKRAIVKDRIEFYSDVINTAPIGLLAMWLSEDPSAAKDVLTYIDEHSIKVGGYVDKDDPVRSALTAILTDDFQRNEAMHAWFDGLNRTNQDGALSLLRDALSASANGDSPA